MDTSSVELQQAARDFIREVLALQPGEKLLIYMDGESDRRLATVIQEQATGLGATVRTVDLPGHGALPHLAGELARAIQAERCDVLCELSEQYFYQTTAWQTALESGVRIYSLAGVDREAFVRCVGRVDREAAHRFGTALAQILRRARQVRVTSALGTDLKCPMTPTLVSRLMPRLRGMRRSFVRLPSDQLNDNERSAFVSGQLCFRGVVERIEGRVVVDGYFWPPRDIGPLKGPIALEIGRGRLVGIRGPAQMVEMLDRWFGDDLREIQHLCIGFNPGATLSGKLLEAERALGCLTIGIGSFPVHADGVLTNVSIAIPGGLIVDNGAFIHPQLLGLVSHLSV